MSYQRALACLILFTVASAGVHAQSPPAFTMAQVLHYPFSDGLASAEHADRIAWVRNLGGVRNVWTARDQRSGRSRSLITTMTTDRRSPSSPSRPTERIWSTCAAAITTRTGRRKAISRPIPIPRPTADGDDLGRVAPGRRAGEDRRRRCSPRSPQRATRLHQGRSGVDARRSTAKASRSGCSSIAARTANFAGRRMEAASPSSPIAATTPSSASSPRRTNRCFISRRPPAVISRRAGRRTVPASPSCGGLAKADRQTSWALTLEKQMPQPWSIWVANAEDGSGRAVWSSPDTLAGSFPDVEGEANLQLGGRRPPRFLRLSRQLAASLFHAGARRNAASCSRPVAFMVEHVAESRDRRFMIYDANTGKTSGG